MLGGRIGGGLVFGLLWVGVCRSVIKDFQFLDRLL